MSIAANAVASLANQRPVGPSREGGTLFGSDIIADILRQFDIPYIAINLGASYRGLHDSIGTGRLTIAICGDGDFLMGHTALWTAARYRIPLLIIVANNRFFFKDEVHQEKIAMVRGRPVENKWIGMRMTDPEIDIAAIARAQGAHAFGPIADDAAPPDAVEQAIAAVESGAVAVVDVRVATGYSAAMSSALGSDL
jgi:TPP-dependent trihydroxycyclohexane-1,2-dione (THcHDO) dehydratase